MIPFPARILCAFLAAAVPAARVAGDAAEILVEAERFTEYGGWLLDPQWMDTMGSPYLLAHGMGQPVAHARTEISVPRPGIHRLWVRTRDWVPGQHPGTFTVAINGRPLPAVFGSVGAGWLWQDGGLVPLDGPRTTLELRDRTGFDGRCDALYFTRDWSTAPPEDGEAGASRRRALLGLPEIPPDAGTVDAVVAGGGIAGCSAALAAARLGLSVALLQNRPVLGGNASTEIGLTPRGTPGPLVDAVARDPAAALAGEKTLALHAGWHVFRAVTEGGRIRAVDARHIATGEEKRFRARVFIDATGSGSLGALAGADFRMGREGRDEFGESLAPETADGVHHGDSPIFRTVSRPGPVPFPDVPWATAVTKGYADLGGQVLGPRHDNTGGLTHFWEYGQYRDPIREGEEIRDHLLRAVYGTFANARRAAPEATRNLALEVGYVPATGESRRLVGDYILTENDIRAGTVFGDAAAVGTGHFCLHDPGESYDFRLGDWRWIVVPPYTIPFRSLYSRNIDNLMMAGKCISASHIAGTSTKTMLNGGQTGVAVGCAAFLCREYDVPPRTVGAEHGPRLQALIRRIGAGERP